ncbi:shikimate kinase [Pacificispira spongiicola]|uniref:shikimate kinase n=1 Tax=Pacificispira spongiicola TaxID=2729598 RepID=UPI0029CA7084|nr:shikimate kinase [Pacificispira spongiicola]
MDPSLNQRVTSQDADRRNDSRKAGPGDTAPDSIPALNRCLVLVGMMGAGKSAVGRQLAQRLGLPFLDADTEIEKAAGCSIAEIFEQYGEAHFRDGERRVIARLVDDGPIVLATGGGAFMDADTRALLKEKALTVWLNADFDILWDRVSRRTHRPLLQTADPKGTLKRLMTERYPVYTEADITVVSDEAPKDETVNRVLAAVSDYIEGETK